MAEAPVAEGYPEVGEQAALDRHIAELRSKYGFTA